MGDLFFKTRKETKAWLDKTGVENYVIRDDLTVDVGTTVDISDMNLTAIPIRFGVVNGDFYCNNNQLTSLSGSPVLCHVFDSGCNNLTNLDGAPETCDRLQCTGNPALADISAVPDGCALECEYDVVAKNQSAMHLSALDTDDAGTMNVSRPKLGRVL